MATSPNSVSDLIPDAAIADQAAPSAASDLIPASSLAPHTSATEQPESLPNNILQFGKGAVEGAISEATGAAKSAISNVGENVTHPIDAAGRVVSNLGSALSKDATSAMKFIADPGRFVSEWYEKNLKGKNAEQAGEVLGPKISTAAAVAAPFVAGESAALTPDMLESARPATVSDQILERSRQAGYVVPPATGSPTILNRAIEGFAGKASVAQAASIKNQVVTDNLVRRALNLPEDAPLTAETLAESRAPAGAIYERVKGAGTVTSSPQYFADLDALTRSSDVIQKDFPKYSSGPQQQIRDLADSLRSENFDAGTAVELSKDLRYNSNSNYSAAARTGDPQMRVLGDAQRQAAEALENELKRHLESIGQPQLAEQWDKARTHIAKTYSVQNALDGAGHVDATKLGKQLLKGKPLSDELETAANFANAFPKAARVLPGKESMPGMSPLDVYGSVAASLAAGNPAPMLLGPGRMAARGLALSRAFQPSGVRAGLGLSEAPQ